MNEYFPEPKYSFRREKGEFDLSSYALKEDLKNGTGVDTSDIAKKLV